MKTKEQQIEELRAELRETQDVLSQVIDWITDPIEAKTERAQTLQDKLSSARRPRSGHDEIV